MYFSIWSVGPCVARASVCQRQLQMPGLLTYNWTLAQTLTQTTSYITPRNIYRADLLEVRCPRPAVNNSCESLSVGS